MIFYSNKAAALYEMNNFKECIEACNQAVKIGQYTNYKNETLAKITARKAKALLQLTKYEESIESFGAALKLHKDERI